MRRATLSVYVLAVQLACRGSHEGAASRASRAGEASASVRAQEVPGALVAGRGVIVRRAQAAAAPFHRIDWEPTLRQVEEFEAVADRDLARKLPATPPDLARRIADYKREYFGVSEHERQLMVVDMFCKLPGDWPETLYGIPPDGGPCYVTVGYDPSTKTIAYASVLQGQ
jgi:hypothetical protein